MPRSLAGILIGLVVLICAVLAIIGIAGINVNVPVYAVFILIAMLGVACYLHLGHQHP